MATNYGVSIPFNDTMGIVSVLSKCSGSNCHSPGGKEVSEFLYDPNDYERSIKKNISKIYNETKTYGKGMANF